MAEKGRGAAPALIIDFHTHIFPPKVRERRAEYARRDPCFAVMYSAPKARMATAEDLISAMDESGVDISVALNIGWLDHSICRETNDYILESAAKYPGRLVPFITVVPSWGALAIEEVERCAGAGARGVGEIRPDVQGFDLADRGVMVELAQVLVQRKLVFLTHASEPVGHIYPGKGSVTPDKLYAFVRTFPELKVVCAHWGGGLPFYAVMPEVSEALANVYFDSAATPYLYRPEIFRHIINMVGPDKVLFGSDYPLLSARRVMEDLDSAALSLEERKAVLRDNAAGLLGL